MLGSSLEPDSPLYNRHIDCCLLKLFIKDHKRSFDEIWAALEKAKVPVTMTKRELAQRMSRIVIPARPRLDPEEFQKKQEQLGILIPSAATSAEAAQQGIAAAKAARENIMTVLNVLTLLDIIQQDQFFNLISPLSRGMERKPFLNNLIAAASFLRAAGIAFEVATRATGKPRQRGRPASPYTSTAWEFIELWEELTGKPVIYPKRQGVDPKSGGAPQSSTHFILLSLRMCNPRIQLKDAETAIRTALPGRRSLSEYSTDITVLQIAQTLESKLTQRAKGSKEQ